MADNGVICFELHQRLNLLYFVPKSLKVPDLQLDLSKFLALFEKPSALKCSFTTTMQSD